MWKGRRINYRCFVKVIFRSIILIAMIGLLPLGNAVYAYEPQTHSVLSEAAYEKSALNDNSMLLENIGIKETDVFKNTQDPDPRTIKQLFSDGARFEDGFADCDSRPKHHFYDPRNDRGLRAGFGLVRGEKSPDWALGIRGDSGEAIDEQDFSYDAANHYLYRALTSIDLDERKNEFGMLFQSLGHIIHHIQDMAQPQHVRNDAHLVLPSGWCSAFPKVWQNPSLYETHTDNFKAGERFQDLMKQNRDTVVVDRARHFWVTQENTGGQGEGLSEFTNNNFISAGTNFKLNNGVPVTDKDGYDLPRPGSLAIPEAIETLFAKRGEKLPCGAQFETVSGCLEGSIQFISTTGKDNRTDAVINNKYASSLSIFDADLEKYNTKVIFEGEPDPRTGNVPPVLITDRKFTLNRFNFDAAHEFLIPRAVAYSAGLINHFFRGRIKVLNPLVETNGISLYVKIILILLSTPTGRMRISNHRVRMVPKVF